MRSGAVGLMTAAGSANYTDISAFFAEATRVLSPDGFLVVYDFGPGRSSAKCPELTSWYSRFLGRWPKPTQGVEELGQATFESVPMDLMSYERFTVVVDLELNGYLDYLMTESNIAAAGSGSKRAEIRSRCDDELRPLFQGSLPVEFELYYACLGQPK